MPTRTKTEAREDLRVALGELFAAQRRLRGRDAQNKDGLTHAQLHLLRVLEEKGGDLPASRLAACADLTPTTVTQMVDGLAKHGLVERVRSEEDRRMVFIRLTEAGREAYRRQRAIYEERSQELLADMSAEELDQAARVLRRVARMLDGL
jgi:MarR family transcriptional regulator, organic hydroperoxide resistance regulator